MIKRILSPFKALRTLRKTTLLLDRQLAGVTQKQAMTLRDGADGWSVLFVACHLRDYELVLRQRIEQTLAEEQPVFDGFDQLALAETNSYARQQLAVVLAELSERRAALIGRLEQLEDAQWLREGTSAQQGPGTVLDLAINAGLHDLDHLEQIMRCLDPQMPVTIVPERPDTADAQQLIAELTADLGAFGYPEASTHGYSVDKLLREGVAFFIVRCAGRAAGCGGVQLYDSDYGELKRMFVRPEFRRQGLGKLLLNHLAEYAREHGVTELRLETGIHQTAAAEMYERFGFQRRGPFGSYVDDPLSIYYEKTI